VRVRLDAFGCLHVSVDARQYPDVRAVYAFPLSKRADYVSFLDGRGHEVALVAHPHQLDDDSRRVLDEALKSMYYVPRITRVYSISEKMGISQWQVVTDRGYAFFEVADRRRDIRRLPGHRYLLTDADGNRFEIANTDDLDPHSRALVHSET